MELLDRLKYEPNAMADAFKEAMKHKATTDGNTPVDINITKLPIGTEVLSNEKLPKP